MSRVTGIVAALAVIALLGVAVGAAPSATPVLDWLFDAPPPGLATARAGNTLYVSGSFSTVSPASGAQGHFYAVSPSTGALVPSGVPPLNDAILARTDDGAGGAYLGGFFTNVGTGVNAAYSARIIHVKADGTVDPAFNSPTSLASVQPKRLARVGPSLVVAADRTIAGGLPPLFALDPVSGAQSPWTPTLPPGDDVVWDMAASGGVVFVVTGVFSGQSRYVTAFDGSTGAALWVSDVAGSPGYRGAGKLVVAGGRLIVALGRLYSVDPATGLVDATWGAGSPADSDISTLVATSTAIYAGGGFSTFNSQPRQRLAAADLLTGTLLLWNPQASLPPAAMAASPSGTVFVALSSSTPPPTINGQTRTIFEIDAAGTVTSFTSQGSGDVAFLQLSGGTLLVSGDPAFTGGLPRAGLAEFDLTSGALLPPTLALSLAGAASSAARMLEHRGVLYLLGRFDAVNGQARAGLAAIDSATGAVLPWPAPGVATDWLIGAEGDWVYINQPLTGNRSTQRRVHVTTGALDPVWLPPPTGNLSFVNGELMRTGPSTGSGCDLGTLLGTLDPVTGAFREWFRTFTFNSGYPVGDGDTVYVVGVVPTGALGFCNFNAVMFAYDRKTGIPVSRPSVAGKITSALLADGRLIVAGDPIEVNGVVVSATTELVRPNADGMQYPGLTGVSAHGDRLVGQGALFGRSRVAAFPLTGISAPSNLRSRSVGNATQFTWDAMATTPTGGYVIEGGFAAGQTAAALAVGNATSVTLPLPAGPIFIRVRPQGSTEVSNEIVAGCLAPPAPPTALTTTLNGTALTLAWTAPADAVTGYTLLAGSASGLSDVATLPLGPQTSVGGAVPGGTFFARVTASNACGTSAPSGEVFFTIGAPDPLPAAPTSLTSTLTGNTLSLSWTAPAGPVTGYVLEAGTAAGLANLGTLRLGATPSLVVPGVPAGTYALRVRAITSAGSGAPSTDVVVVVP